MQHQISFESEQEVGPRSRSRAVDWVLDQGQLDRLSKLILVAIARRYDRVGWGCKIHDADLCVVAVARPYDLDKRLASLIRKGLLRREDVSTKADPGAWRYYLPPLERRGIET